MSDFYGDGPHHVPDYLVPSILVTIFCACPCNSRHSFSATARVLESGDYAGAQRDAEKARVVRSIFVTESFWFLYPGGLRVAA